MSRRYIKGVSFPLKTLCVCALKCKSRGIEKYLFLAEKANFPAVLCLPDRSFHYFGVSQSIPELHKTRRSPDLEAQNIVKGPVRWTAAERMNQSGNVQTTANVNKTVLLD